jgi:hypothetical protein
MIFNFLLIFNYTIINIMKIKLIILYYVRILRNIIKNFIAIYEVSAHLKPIRLLSR